MAKLKNYVVAKRRIFTFQKIGGVKAPNKLVAYNKAIKKYKNIKKRDLKVGTLSSWKKKDKSKWFV